MKASITIAIFAVAAAVSAVRMATIFSEIQIAYAVAPHSECGIGDGRGNGASRCAGNINSTIKTPNGFVINR
jgi:hypothetical protein